MWLTCWPRRLLAPGGGGGGAPDLISALPDDLLLLVLARLPCAGAAARTAVLSRRWRGLWARPRLGRIVFLEVALPSVEAALGRVPRPPPPARVFPPRHPRPRQASAQARPQGAPGRHRPRQLAAPRRHTARAGGARPRTPLRLNRRPPRPRLVLLRPRHLHPERIRCATHRLKVILQRSVMKGGCPPPCLCESLNWRSQTISLPALKEVDINGFEGEENGTDFLRLMLKCPPMLKRIIVKLSLEASASNDGCAKICNIFKAHSSVECDVYHSSGLMHNSQNCWRT